jgi:hypothetical protein
MPRRYTLKVDKPTDWIYLRMYEALQHEFPSIQKPADMAPYIDQKSRHTVFQAKSEGRVPKGYVETVAELTGRRVEWIRTGQGPVYKDERGLADLGPEVQECLQHWRGMSTLQRRLWLWVAALMLTYEDDLLRWCEAHARDAGGGGATTPALPPHRPTPRLGYLIAASPSAEEEGRTGAPLDDPDEFL